MSGSELNNVPRPVADAPLPALLERTEDLAKRWALELIASLPLARAAEIPLADFASGAPPVLALALSGLASDADLQKLTDGGRDAAVIARISVLTGAHDHAAVLVAVEAMRAVLWRELIDELHHPAAQLVADLASRLAYVCSSIAILVLRGDAGEAAQDTPPVDLPPTPWSDTPQPPIEIHDARNSGPSAWITSIGRCLRDHAHDRQPFAVELIEVIGIERLRHSEGAGGLAHLVGEIQSALHSELRPADILTRESEGRYWLVAPHTDGPGALMLAERLIAVVRASVSHRGVPLEVAIGIATCPADGQEAAELAAQADMKLYGARAAGLSVEPADLKR
jgi:GGDEF domain-containing protein